MVTTLQHTSSRLTRIVQYLPLYEVVYTGQLVPYYLLLIHVRDSVDKVTDDLERLVLQQSGQACAMSAVKRAR